MEERLIYLMKFMSPASITLWSSLYLFKRLSSLLTLMTGSYSLSNQSLLAMT